MKNLIGKMIGALAMVAAMPPMAAVAEATPGKAEIKWTKTICEEPGRYIGWPTVCRLQNGDLLAVFSGDREQHVCPWGKVQMVRSKDNGETWSAPVTIAKTKLDDRDAGIVQLPNGEIVVTWFTSTCWTWKSFLDKHPDWKAHYAKFTPQELQELPGDYIIRSKDNGETWTKPEKLSVYGQSPHGPIVLKSGALLELGRITSDNKNASSSNGGQRSIINVTRSDDGGRTWKMLCPEIPDRNHENDVKWVFHEPHVAELNDGTLVAMIRYHGKDDDLSVGGQGYMRISFSKDGGYTWTPMTKTPLLGLPPHLMVLQDGRLLCVYGRRLKNPGFGEFACLSTDGGKTWDVENEICLCPGINGDLGYPASCQLPNGDIVTVFYQHMAAGQKTVLAATKWRAPAIRRPVLKEVSRRVLRTHDKSPMNFCFANNFPDGTVYLSHSIGVHMKDEHHVCMSSADYGQTWKLEGPTGGMNSFVTRDGKKRFVSCWDLKATNVHTISVRTFDDKGKCTTVRSQISWPYVRQMRLHRSVVRLPNDDLLVSGYGQGPKKRRCYAFVLVSKDDGITWQYLSDFPETPDAQEGMNEVGMTCLKDGRVFACVRTGSKQPSLKEPCEYALAGYISTDRGATWKFQRYIADYGVDPQLLTLADGTVALVSGRPGVYIMLDPTGTAEHFQRYDIYSGKGSSYSTLMEVKPGQLLLIYDESSFVTTKGGPAVSRIMAVDFKYGDLEPDPVPQPVTEKINLLENGDLGKNWYVWLKSQKARNVDPNHVFTAEGSTLRVDGSDMGCVTTKAAYRDYQLTLEYRYVDNPKQLNKVAARDGGLLFHSTGVDGAYSGIWQSSFEYNIIQGATGDLILVNTGNNLLCPGRYRATGRVDAATRGLVCQHWDPKGTEINLVNSGRIRRPDVDLKWQNLKTQAVSPNEKPIGEWNTAKIVCRGDRAQFYFNGMLVGDYYKMSPAGGRIQLQSEGFGIEYRNIVLEPLR